MDLIDRDVACQKMTALYEEDCRMYGVSIPECFDSDRAIKALKELPSAESGILSEFKSTLFGIGEICVDVSNCHITAEEGIQQIRDKYLYVMYRKDVQNE